MTEQHSSSISPADILQLKSSIQEMWKRLPAEHQATMLLVLLNSVQESEYGPWTLSAIETLAKPPAQSAQPELPTPPITPADLERVGFGAEDISLLTEADLQQIAQAIVRHFVSDGFWQELEFQVLSVLERKRDEASGKEPDGMG